MLELLTLKSNIMNHIQLAALDQINYLARRIQANDRSYYKARIIEFLTDIVRESTSKNVEYLTNFVDSDERGHWGNIFLNALAKDMNESVQENNT